MAQGTIQVKGLESAVGEWGVIQADQVTKLPAQIAESLIRAGIAIEVDDAGEPVAQKKVKRGGAKLETKTLPADADDTDAS